MNVKQAWKKLTHAWVDEQTIIEQFLASMEARRCSPKSVYVYRNDLATIQRIMGRDLIGATTADVEAYVAKVRHHKASTVRHRLLTLAQFYKFCVKREF